MKFLHLADLHLGKRVNGFDLLEDQRYILEQVLALCDEHDVEAVLLAGDIYDAPVPPAAACTLLDWFLTHPEAHAALRRQAAESAEQFSAQQFAQRVERIYQMQLARRPACRAQGVSA